MREIPKQRFRSHWKRGRRLLAPVVLLLGFPLTVFGASEEFQRLLQSAREGNPVDQYNVALIYQEGSIRDFDTGKIIRIDKMDQAKALHFFQMSAAQGFQPAMYPLARIYAYGRTELRNPRKASELFYRAAQSGDKNAMYDLALCFQNGTGVQKDQRQADFWMRNAAERGKVRALVRTGQVEEAAGVAASRAKSAAQQIWAEISEPFKQGYQKEETRHAIRSLFGE